MEKNEIIELKKGVLSNIGKTLIEKNKRYGNAALSPVNIFYKGDSATSIEIRLDDKMSRIINSDTIRLNDMFDVLGYLFLFSISKNYFGVDKIETFDKKVSTIQNTLFKNAQSEEQLDNIYAFSKVNKVLIQLDNVVNDIRKNGATEVNVFNLMEHIIDYFVDNNISDFSELID